METVITKKHAFKTFHFSGTYCILFSTGIIKVIMIGFEGSGRHVVNSRSVRVKYDILPQTTLFCAAKSVGFTV
jgi:hypothetical protein